MKKTNTKWLITAIIGLIVLAAIIGYGMYSASQPGKYDALAQCLANKGVKFYGAFWCPHCAEQEKDLEMSRQKLKAIGLYVECSTPDGQNQTQICKDEGVTGYPTWVLPDGTRLNGVQPLATLASSTQCALTPSN